MAIAVPVSTGSALANLPDLISEVRDELDDANYSGDKIKRAVSRAEAGFNRILRTPEMETSLAVNVTGAAVALPSDFLAMRNVYRDAQPDRALKSMSPQALVATYLGQAGEPEAYAIEGEILRFGPVGDILILIDYYQKIPPLSDGNPVNWLISEHPDLYLAQTLAIIYFKLRDDTAAARWQGIADQTLAEIRGASGAARWGASPLVPRGASSIRGVRA